jgi:lysophospholipase L1-like esterase
VVKFTGVTLDAGTLSAPTKRPKIVLVFGDSIVEGSRTLNATATNDTDRNDSWQGWAARQADQLGAEVGVVGFGGQGINATGVGGVPIFGSAYNLVAAGLSRSFTTPAPDLIVINQGTNDSATGFNTAYAADVEALLAATPSTTKIALMRPLNGNLASNVAAVAAGASVPSRVSYIDTTGWWNSADASDGLHPYGYTNIARIAPLLGAQLRSLLAPAAGGGSFAWAA